MRRCLAGILRSDDKAAEFIRIAWVHYTSVRGRIHRFTTGGLSGATNGVEGNCDVMYWLHSCPGKRFGDNGALVSSISVTGLCCCGHFSEEMYIQDQVS